MFKPWTGVYLSCMSVFVAFTVPNVVIYDFSVCYFGLTKKLICEVCEVSFTLKQLKNVITVSCNGV